MPEQLYHITANRADVRIFEMKAGEFLQLVQIQLALNQKLILTDANKFFRLLLVKFVLDLTHKLSKNVVKGHYTDRSAVFVNYHSKMRPFTQKLVEQLFKRHELRHRHQFPLDREQIGLLLFDLTHQILDVNKANRVVQMPPNQRKAGVTGLDRNLDIRLKRVLYIEVDHVSTRSHDVSNDPPAKVQGIYQ